MTTTSALRTVATVALLGAVASGCGRTATTEPASGPTSKAPVDSMSVELSGGLDGKSAERTEPLTCRWFEWGVSGHRYSVAGAVRINGQSYQLTLGQASAEAGRTYPLSGSGSGNVTFYNKTPGSETRGERWANLATSNPAEVKGTVTINPDRSGSVDGVLSRQKGTPGGPITIKASWSCATILGAP